MIAGHFLAGGACANRPQLCLGDEACFGTFGLRRVHAVWAQLTFPHWGNRLSCLIVDDLVVRYRNANNGMTCVLPDLHLWAGW